jgi:hypothetical protein
VEIEAFMYQAMMAESESSGDGTEKLPPVPLIQLLDHRSSAHAGRGPPHVLTVFNLRGPWHAGAGFFTMTLPGRRF